MPLKVNGLEIKVVPIAPLAMAQAMEEVEKVLNFSQIIQGMGPAGQMAIKQEEMIDYVAEKLGIPQRLITTKVERMMMMQQAQQQAQQMAQQNPEAAGAVAEQVMKEEQA